MITGMWIDSLLLVFAGTIPLILLIIYNKRTASSTVKDTYNKFDEALKDFNSTEKHVGDNQLTGIAIDELNSKVAILKRTNFNEDFIVKVIPFSSIFESSISEDGETLIRTSRGGQIGGALVGGALAGGTGAIIGGLSSSKTSSQVVSKIELKLTIDDLSNPIETINFLSQPTPLKKDNMIYKYTSQEAEKWHKRFSIIIKRMESNKETI